MGGQRCRERPRVEAALTEAMVSSLLLGLSSLRLLSDRTPPYRRSPLHIVYDFGLAMLTMWLACGPNRERNTGNKEGRIR